MVGYVPDEKIQLPSYAYSIAGAGSGFVVRAICQPFDVLKIRLQLQEQPIKPNYLSKYHGLIHACRTICAEEGLTAFWKGHNPAQLLSVLFGLVQFSTFEVLTKYTWQLLPKKFSEDPLRPVNHFICGSVAGCCATLVSFPFDVVRTRFIAQGEPKVYHSVLDALQKIVKHESLFGLYRGLVPTLIQTAPHTGLQFAFYSLFTWIWNSSMNHRAIHHVGLFESLICGSSAGLCAKVIVYPFDLTKKRLQMEGFEYGKVVVGQSRQYKGFIRCIKTIYKEEGFLAFYKGLSPSIMKAFCTTALHFCAYEQFCTWLRIFYKNE